MKDKLQEALNLLGELRAETKTTTPDPLEVAKILLDLNPSCRLTGSLGLQIQGCSTGRPSKDLDIECPVGYIFVVPDGFRFNESRDIYEDDEFTQRRAEFMGVDIDLFTSKSLTELPNKAVTVTAGTFNCKPAPRILYFKMKYALQGTSGIVGNGSAKKHLKDIINVLLGRL